MSQTEQLKITQPQQNPAVVLSVHTTAIDISAVLAEVIQTNPDCCDPERLTGLIFDQLTRGAVDLPRKFGIGTAIHGDASRVIELNPHRDHRRITVDGPQTDAVYSFTEFVDTKRIEL